MTYNTLFQSENDQLQTSFEGSIIKALSIRRTDFIHSKNKNPLNVKQKKKKIAMVPAVFAVQISVKLDV